MKREKQIGKFKRKSKMLFVAGLECLKNDGIVVTLRRILEKTKNVLKKGTSVSLERWTEVPLCTEQQMEEQRKKAFGRKVIFSIITPLYNTDEKLLIDMIDSVRNQTYPGWELCMADGSDEKHGYVQRICQEYSEKDSRIKYVKLPDNLGIVGNSNACIDMATGDYISILDHDDVLHPAALFEVMKKICEEDADFIYTDELKFESPNIKDAIGIHFKPDYAPDNLLANNYICHFTSVKKSLLEKCGAFRDGFDGSQDHELFLRLTDAAENVVHIPKELYYWRAHEGSVAKKEDSKPYAAVAGKRAVESFLKGKGINATVDFAGEGLAIYRVSYVIPSSQPLVSIIIPNYEHLDDLKGCISSIIEKTTYGNYEIVVVENNSKDPNVFDYYDEINKESNINVIIWPGTGFNWSALNNYGIKKCAKGEYLLLLNNDIEVISPDWIQEMLMHAQRSEVGVVGAMLYYPDDTIQHAGVIIGMKGVADHAFANTKRGDPGYCGRLLYAQDMSAVTGACFMLRRSVYEEMNGFDETLPVDFNDVDFCLRLREKGYLIVWTPYAELYHYESKSRGHYDSSKKRRDAEKWRNIFTSKWQKQIDEGDPYYNKNLSLKYQSFTFSKDEYERRKNQR